MYRENILRPPHHLLIFPPTKCEDGFFLWRLRHCATKFASARELCHLPPTHALFPTRHHGHRSRSRSRRRDSHGHGHAGRQAGPRTGARMCLRAAFARAHLSCRLWWCSLFSLLTKRLVVCADAQGRRHHGRHQRRASKNC